MSSGPKIYLASDSIQTIGGSGKLPATTFGIAADSVSAGRIKREPSLWMVNRSGYTFGESAAPCTAKTTETEKQQKTARTEKTEKTAAPKTTKTDKKDKTEKSTTNTSYYREANGIIRRSPAYYRSLLSTRHYKNETERKAAFKKYDDLIKNTKSSNGMTIKEAIETIYSLQKTFIERDKSGFLGEVQMQMVDPRANNHYRQGFNIDIALDPKCDCLRVDKHGKPTGDTDLLERALQAYVELSQNEELMEAYKERYSKETFSDITENDRKAAKKLQEKYNADKDNPYKIKAFDLEDYAQMNARFNAGSRFMNFIIDLDRSEYVQNLRSRGMVK